MLVTELLENYWFHDGALQVVHLNVAANSAVLELAVKRIISGKASGNLQKENLVPCTLKLFFEDLVEATLINKFPTQGHYLDFTLYEYKGEVTASFLVHDNSSSIHANDNWVVKARKLTWKEV